MTSLSQPSEPAPILQRQCSRDAGALHKVLLRCSCAQPLKRLAVPCRAYVLVAWIWSLAWHMPLDLIKWAMAYVLNEDGFRDRMHGRTPESMAAAAQAEVKEGAAPGASPALGRVSAGGRPSISRTSVQVSP